MDNLFSFPTGAQDVAAAIQASGSDAPSNGLSNEPTAVAEAPGTAPNDGSNVRRLSEDVAIVREQLHVRLKLLDERVFDVHVSHEVSVAEFRVKVEETTAIPVHLQRLIYRGKLLKDGALLSSYEIQDGHMIHLVSKPVAAPPSTPATASSAHSASETATLDRFVGRSRERLRQTMRDEMRQQQQQQFELPVHTPVTRQSTQRDFELLRERSRFANRMMQTEDEFVSQVAQSLNDTFDREQQATTTAPSVTRVRRPGAGDPTGDAWNLAVLREALGQHSDRVPARPSNRPTTLVRESQRQGFEQQQMAENDAPAATAAAMGLTPTAAAATSATGTTPTVETPNLDHITQGILTLRTVLSTAALPPPVVEQATSSTTENDPVEAVDETTANDPSRLFADHELEALVAAAERDFNDQTRRDHVETVPLAVEEEEEDEAGASSAFSRLNEAIELIDRSIADANRVRAMASQAVNVAGTTGARATSIATPIGDTAAAPVAVTSAPLTLAASSSLGGSPRRGRRRFFVGQWLDVKDTVNQWLECTVMDMSDEKVLVHYHGWPSRWDEWIDFDSDRIAAFRTRTHSTQHAQHLSPVPTTRLPNAPPTGDSSMRSIVPQLRDLMHQVMPHIDQLAALCENDGQEDEQHHQELSEMAHLMAPFFDRFGRVLVDSARQMDPFLRPELRQEERRRRHQRARSGNSSVNRQTPPSATTEPQEDSAISVRDLITPAARAPQQDAATTRRSIDVHIHAIVAPSSLSSLASLARLGTAIAGAMGSSGSAPNTPALQPSNNPNELEDAFGLPRLRPVQEGTGNRSILTDITEPDEVDRGGRHRDTSRTPLLSAFRRSPSSGTSRLTGGANSRVRRPAREPAASRLQDFLSDDFFGPSFSQDSDDMDDDDPLINGNGFHSHRHNGEDERDEVRYDEIPSPRSDSEDGSSIGDPGTPRIGVIPEVEEAERRHQEQLESGSSIGDSSIASSSSSSSSIGYPTFLEVMRRTLSGVRNFGFSSSSTQGETTATTSTVAAQDPPLSDSESSSSSSSSLSSSRSIATTDELPPTQPAISTGFGPAFSPPPSYSFGEPAPLGSSVAPTNSTGAAQSGSGFTAYRSWGFESQMAFRPRQPSSTSDDDDEDLDSVD